MAFKPLLPKTEYIRLPIPDYSEIKAPPHPPLASPFQATPSRWNQYPRKQS